MLQQKCFPCCCWYQLHFRSLHTYVNVSIIKGVEVKCDCAVRRNLSKTSWKKSPSDADWIWKKMMKSDEEARSSTVPSSSSSAQDAMMFHDFRSNSRYAG